MVKSKTNMDQLYTYTQVKEKLGIGPATLTSLVDKGVIQRVIPPGRKTGYYVKSQVDDYFEKMNIFAQTYTTRTENKYEIRLATEKDIHGIALQHQKTFGVNGAVPEEIQLAWHQKNPYIDFIATLDDEVVGHLELVPLIDKALMGMIQGTLRGWDITADDIEKYDEEKQYNIFIMYMAANPTNNNIDKRMDSALLMREAQKFMAEMAEKSRLIKAFYATSRTREGIFLLERMQFAQLNEYSDARRKSFVIDMGKNDGPLAKEYRKYVKSLKLPRKLTQGIIE